jgi:predicted MPP superfamily phosphohydrolase
MKTWSFLIFFSVVLIIYAAINCYILKRGLQALAQAGIYRTVFLYFFLFLMASYPVGRILEQFFRNSVTEYLVIIGAFYLAIMVYGFLFLIIIDVLRLGNHLFHFFPSVIEKNPLKSAEISTYIISAIIIIIVFVGHLNTLFPRIHTLDIRIQKPANGIEKLTVAVVSDVHLGTVIQANHLERIVNKINQINPDIVLLPGDIVDEDVAPVIEQNMAEKIQKLNPRYGIYAITGNHEYFSGVEKAVAYLEKAGVRVLQDDFVKVADAFYVIGRKDRMAERMTGGRKELKDIMEGIDRSLPLIMMDHQPYELDKAKENGVDLQLSGHTHHGQLFPFNYVTRALYELSWGYLKKGATHYYVSCGVGTWGPPVRTSSRPEVVQIKIKFNKDDKEQNN